MADEFSDLTTALSDVRTLYSTIMTTVADEARAGDIQRALTGAIFHELTTIAAAVPGQDFDYTTTTLPGPSTVAAVKTHYAELSAL